MGLFSRGGRISELWSYDAKAQLVSSPAIMQAGHAHHIILGTKNGRITCIDESGKEVWQFSAQEKLGAVDEYFVDTERVHSIDAAPIAADVDADGKLEIVFGTEMGMLYCLNNEGKLLWKHDCGGSIKQSACVADINMDGKPEVLVGAGNKVVVLTGKGQKLFEYDSEGMVESVPGVLHGKRSLIIFGNSNGTLTAITPAQELAWKVELESKITAAPAFFIDPEERRMVIGTLGGNIACVSEHGEIVWVRKTEGSIYNAAVITDINEDKSPEIVLGSCDNNVYAFTVAGQKIWSYETDFWITATPIVADIDGDGKLEIVAGSYDHSLYVLDSKGTYVLDYVPGLSGIMTQAGHYSNLLTSDPGEQTGKKLFQYKTSSLIVGCAATHAEKPMIIVTTKDGKVTGLRHQG